MKEASSHTTLYWLVREKKIEPDIFFSFLELFWPKFVEKDGYVFLDDKYSEEEFSRLVKEKASPEYWINLLTVGDFFSKLENGDEKSEKFTKSLIEIWQEKLKRDFPDKNFTVQYIYDEEYGDCGLTFYQASQWI
jgi:hypothetical protein